MHPLREAHVLFLVIVSDGQYDLSKDINTRWELP